MPNRARSKTMVPRTLTSASQPLHPPALTCRNLSDRPKRRRSVAFSIFARGSARPRTTRSSRSRAANRYSWVSEMAPSGQPSTHSAQKRQRPMSRARPSSSKWTASVGHASTQSRHPSGHFFVSRTGPPRKRSGSVGGELGYATVRCPCWKRARTSFSMGRLSEIVSAVREIEALVAEWKIGNLLVSEGHGEPRPVVHRRVHDLVGRESAVVARHRDVADLAAPAFHERRADAIRPERFALGAHRAFRKGIELISDERARTLDFEPPNIGSREDVTRVPRGDGDVCEPVYPVRVIVPHVAFEAARARSHADEPQRLGDFRRNDSGSLESGLHRRAIPKKLDGALHVARRSGESAFYLAATLVVDVEPEAARSYEAASETTSAQERR